MKNLIIYGGNIGAMLLAKELAQNEEFNIILINPSKYWGGYFGGIAVNGFNFDLGMNLFEFTSFCSDSDSILDYNPNIKSESGKYSKIIETLVKNEIDTHIVKTPLVYVNGNYFKDYYISNSLEVLCNLDNKNRMSIIRDLQAIVANKSFLHASNKNINPELFYDESYHTASILNHGATFHSLLIEPLVKKILNISSQTIPAILHRIPWAPLYYPETLLAYLNNNFSETITVSQFEYPKNENFSIFVDNLFRIISNLNNVQLLTDKLVDFNSLEKVVTLESQTKLNYDHIVFGVDIAEYDKICANQDDLGDFEKASFIFIFVRFPKAEVKLDFSVLFILDADIPIYRITNQTNLKESQSDNYVDWIIEINSDYLAENTDPDVSTRNLIQSILIRMELLISFNPNIFEIKHLKNAINLPTFKNIYLFDKLKSRITINDNINFIGNINNLFANSFNDNLIQALLISKKIKI